MKRRIILTLLNDYSMGIYRSPKDPFIYNARGLVNKQLEYLNDAKSDFQLALIYAQNNNNTSLVEKINLELEKINLELVSSNSELEETNS